MNKDAKRSLNIIMIAVIAVALVTVAAFGYAQSEKEMGNDVMDMMGGKGMGQMHKQMAKNLDPGLGEQTDKMHEQCEKLHDDEAS